VPGQFISGRHAGAVEIGCNPSTFRNRMERLTKPPLSFISMEKNKLFTVVTVLNWELYQSDENGKRTDEGQAKDKRRTSEGQAEDTDKKGKNVRTYKQWTADDLRIDVAANNADGVLRADEANEFVEYWMESNPTGKSRLSMEKTWSTRRRMTNAVSMIYAKRRMQQPPDSTKPRQMLLHPPNSGV